MARKAILAIDSLSLDLTEVNAIFIRTLPCYLSDSAESAHRAALSYSSSLWTANSG